MASRAVDSETDARREPRYPLGLRGSARIAISIDLIDASVNGARCRLSVPLPAGTLIKIGLPAAQQRHARVVWTKGEVTGCEWVAPLQPYELRALREAVAV